MAKSLSIIYTFLPYVDTAGIVFAKRMQAEIKEPMTVISCKAYNGAPVDNSLSTLVSPYLEKLIEIDAKFTYREWENFEDFYNKAISAYQDEVKSGVVFNKIYSRSMSVISHLVAYKIKCLNPEITWIAEFSDPIIKDVTGVERETILPEVWLRNFIDVKQIECFRQYNNLFSLSEILVYLFADQIKFTNDLQRDFMINYFSKEILNKNIIRQKVKLAFERSIIVPHPSLNSKFYSLEKFDVEGISSKYVNIAYFGNINSKRTFNTLFESWLKLNKKSRDKFRFYVFTNIREETVLKSIPLDLHEYIQIRKGLPYLEFLNSMQYFDYLLSVDTEVKEIFNVNPFLPSKISDYLGSNSKILALVESGSPTDLLKSDRIVKFDFNKFDIRSLM
ncbi:hypothetical protein [Acinetobacter rudis]|uniref:hypothetical protein n=1 Tax=Acinetobacter rudis TaxID=632955 RepID=UPI00333F0F06